MVARTPDVYVGRTESTMQVRVLDEPQYAADQDSDPQGYTETSVHVSKRMDHYAITYSRSLAR
jgi:hypothetical protein